MLTILLFIGLLDFQRVALPNDIDGFTVEIQDETTTDCAMLPHSDGTPLELEEFLRQWSVRPQDATDAPPGQHAEELPTSLLPAFSGLDDGRLRVMPVPVPQPPDPLPEPIPVPAPPMVAVTSITGAMLLYYLFYRRTRRKQ